MHSFLAAYSRQAKDVILGLVLNFSEIKSYLNKNGRTVD